VPCFNEHANLEPFYAAVTDVMKPLEYNYELMFIDDGSTDTTRADLERLSASDRRVIPVELVRNFGKEIAITAGLNRAKGEAAIMIDADLQHPPGLIPEFLDKWHRGAEVVVGVRLPSKHTSLPKRLGSQLYYRIMSLISETPVTPRSTDYRLLDRLVIDEFNRFTDHNRMTRGLLDWLGFNKAYVYFEPHTRLNGGARYTYKKLLGLAMTSFTTMSFFPLKLSLYIGTIITLVSLPVGIFIIIEKYLMHDPWGLSITGTAELGVLIVFLVGILLIGQGLMALYIANIYRDAANRPLYVVRRRRKQ